MGHTDYSYTENALPNNSSLQSVLLILRNILTRTSVVFKETFKPLKIKTIKRSDVLELYSYNIVYSNTSVLVSYQKTNYLVVMVWVREIISIFYRRKDRSWHISGVNSDRRLHLSAHTRTLVPSRLTVTASIFPVYRGARA